MKILVTLSVPDDKVDASFADHLKFYLNQTQRLGCTVDSVFEVAKPFQTER